MIRRVYTPDEIDAARDAVTAVLLAAGNRQRGASILFRCPSPQHDDAHPSASWHVEKGAWTCYSRQCHARHGGGTMALAALLGVTVGGDVPPELVEAATAARETARRAADEDAARRAAALERLVVSQADADAVAHLWRSPAALSALAARCITREAAALWSIGAVPSTPWGWPALAWPWILGAQPQSFQFRRLTDDDGTGRYRWHGAVGANGTRLHLADVIRSGSGPLVVVEGFLKAATLFAHGWRNVAALVNSGSLDAATCDRLLATGDRLIFAPDPDALDATRERARHMGARVAVMPGKPDDIVIDGGADALRRYLREARAA